MPGTYAALGTSAVGRRPESRSSLLDVAPERRDHRKNPRQERGLSISGYYAVHSVVADALVVAVPPVGTACVYGIAIQPSAAATIAVRDVWEAIPAVMAILSVMAVAFVTVVIVAVTVYRDRRDARPPSVAVMPATAVAVMLAATTVVPATAVAVMLATTATTVVLATAIAVMLATTAAMTVTTTVAATALVTDKRHDTGSVALQDRQRGCLRRSRYKTCGE